MHLWDGFLALWVVQEIKVNNEYEVVSTSRLEPEAEYIYYDLSIVCIWGRWEWLIEAALHSGFPRTEVLLSPGCPRALAGLLSLRCSKVIYEKRRHGLCGSWASSWAWEWDLSPRYNKIIRKKSWTFEIEFILSV